MSTRSLAAGGLTRMSLRSGRNQTQIAKSSLTRRVRSHDLDAVGELFSDLVGDLLAEDHVARLAAGDDFHRARVEDCEGEAARERLARDLDDEVCVRVVARQDHAPRLKLFALAKRVLDLAPADEDRV